MSKYVIAETSASTWNYHIREVVNDTFYYGGGAPRALCGQALGWDTRIPISAWALRGGMKSNLPESWCAECGRAAGIGNV
jgi:hypothetical protein